MTAVAAAPAATIVDVIAGIKILARAPGLSHETTVDRDLDLLKIVTVVEVTETVMTAEIVAVMVVTDVVATTRTKEVAALVAEDAIEEIAVAARAEMKTAKVVLTSVTAVPTLETAVTTAATTVMVPTMIRSAASAVAVSVVNAIAAWIETPTEMMPKAKDLMVPDRCMMTSLLTTLLQRSLKRLGLSQQLWHKSRPRLPQLSQMLSRMHLKSPRIDHVV